MHHCSRKIIFIFVIFNLSFSNDLCSALDISADNILYDSINKEITAVGNVRIKHNQYTIEAKQVLVQELEGMLFGEDNIVIYDNNDNVYHAQKIRYDYNNGKIYISNFKAKIQNNMLITASSITGQYNELYDVQNLTFSPCKLCKNKKGDYRALWQIRSKEAHINMNSKKITYKHAFLDVLNRPVFFLPFFATPTPDVTRQSGFLMPKFKSSDTLGNVISIPYYYTLSPTADITITPNIFISRNTRMSYALELRDKNKYNLYLNYMPSANNKHNLYLNGEAKLDLSCKNKFGLIVNRLFSEDNFLKKYEITNKDTLISTSYWQYYFRSGYVIFNPFVSMQNLVGSNSLYSNIAPRLYWYYNEPILQEGKHKISWIMQGHFINSYEDSKPIINAISNAINWKIFTKDGSLINIKPSILLQSNDKNNNFVVPQLYLDWKRPLYKSNNENSITILEPFTNLNLISVDNKNNKKIFEALYNISVLNLRSLTNFSNQINYGIRSNFLLKEGDNINFALGLSNRFNYSNIYNAEISANFDKIYFSNKVQFNNANVIYNEIDVRFDLPKISLALDYTFIDQEYFQKEEINYDAELGLSVWYNVYKEWWFNLNTRRKLGAKPYNWNQPSTIKEGIGLRYKCDCLNVDFNVTQMNFSYGNIKPSLIYSLNLSLPILSS